MGKASMYLGAGGLLLACPAAVHAQNVIIKCVRPCRSVVQAVESNGGVVRYRYTHVDAIAADLRGAPALNAVRQVVEPGAIRKDLEVALPSTGGRVESVPAALNVEASLGAPLDAATLAATVGEPNAYLVNNGAMNLAPLHGQQVLGQDMKVAVIDSGIRPNFAHLTLDGSVIGGEDLVGDALGFSNTANSGHGTFVAGMISANVTFVVGGTLRTAIARHCPSCLLPASPTTSQLPVLGTAPLSSIYAVRVFGPTGGAPESRIIAAMERVLELRGNFDSGLPESRNADGSFNALNIRVCNMSLGGATLHAGRDLWDQLTEEFLTKDIVLVVSAGNEGPSGMTGGSPGTGFGALTVGASSSPVHERILRELQFGAGFGTLYRPFGGVQTAYFSSRGPTTDGRVDPEVVANGFASFGQGMGAAPGGLTIASGTSFATPSLSGVAAVLRQAVPSATARQVRNAIFLTANPSLLTDGSGRFDQGWGHVDAGAAMALLESWSAPDVPGVEGWNKESVELNLMRSDVRTFNGTVTRSVTGLKPGQRFETLYVVEKDTSAVTIALSDVVPGAIQNTLFGDDILLTVHTAKTSAIGPGEYPVFLFTTGTTITLLNPDQGLMRVTVNGDWTNASPIDATIAVSSERTKTPEHSAYAHIEDGQTIAYAFSVPAGVTRLEAQLEFDNGWGAYPTNDIDLVLVPPAGDPFLAGATLNAPERVGINNPVAGQWTAVVDGFSVLTKHGDRFSLRLTIDGTVVKLR